MQNGGHGLDVFANEGFTVFLLFWFLIIVFPPPKSTDTPISNEYGPSALDIATGFSATANDVISRETVNIDSNELIFILLLLYYRLVTFWLFFFSIFILFIKN